MSDCTVALVERERVLRAVHDSVFASVLYVRVFGSIVCVEIDRHGDASHSFGQYGVSGDGCGRGGEIQTSKGSKTKVSFSDRLSLQRIGQHLDSR